MWCLCRWLALWLIGSWARFSDLFKKCVEWRGREEDTAEAPEMEIPGANLGLAPHRVKAGREAADRTLAVTAKGRTRWSRAILMSRLKLKFRKHKRQGITKKPRFSVLRLKGKAVPSLQRQIRLLGRLIPGCKEEPLVVILEEAIDYIRALEMQLRAMTALANLLSAPSSSGAAAVPAEIIHLVLRLGDDYLKVAQLDLD